MSNEANAESTPTIARSPVNVANLPNAVPPVIADVAPGESFDLRIHPVAKRIGDSTLAMLSYGGSIPGPTLRVRQGSEITVHVTNKTDMGLYGTVIVEPADPSYWPAADRGVVLTLDDILIEDGRIAPVRSPWPHLRRHGTVRQRAPGRRRD